MLQKDVVVYSYKGYTPRVIMVYVRALYIVTY